VAQGAFVNIDIDSVYHELCSSKAAQPAKFSPSYPGLKGLLKRSTAITLSDAAGPKNPCLIPSNNIKINKVEKTVEKQKIQKHVTIEDVPDISFIQKPDQDENACDFRISPSLPIEEIEKLILNSFDQVEVSTLVHGETCDNLVFSISANKGLEALREFAHESKKHLVNEQSVKEIMDLFSDPAGLDSRTAEWKSPGVYIRAARGDQIDVDMVLTTLDT
jgi:hypothetical protein